jgi:Skp family chaperone for outer membrane proteins
MRHFYHYLAWTLASCLAMPMAPAGLAQTAQPQAPPMKIAAIAFQPAVATTGEGQQMIHDLQTEFAPKQAELVRLNSVLEALKNQLQTGNWSAAERTERQGVIDQKQKELTQEAEAAQNAFQAAMQKAFGVVAAKFSVVANNYAQQHGFTVLFDDSSQDNPILWALPSADITQAAVQAYDAASGISPSKQGQSPSQTSPPQAIPAKVALVGFQAAVADTNEGKQAMQDVQSEFTPKKKELEELAAEVEALKKELQSGNWSDAERASRQARTDLKQKQLTEESGADRDAFQAEMQKRYNDVASKFYDKLADYVSRNGYTIVFDRTPSFDKLTSLLWTAPGIQLEALKAQLAASADLTSTMVEAYNLIPVPPSSPQPPPPQVAQAAQPTRGFTPEPASSTASSPIPIPHNYALIFATDDYAHWPRLTNPISDADAVNQTLTSLYNFHVEEVRNPTDDQILAKLTEYLHRKFEPQDQLLIMFSGHGYFDPDLGKGFLVPANALLVKDDIGHRSLLAHETVMGYVNRIPATHVVLVLDACFAGTLDRKIADSGLRGDVSSDPYAHASLPELMERKEPKRTRRYITSGGKDFVPDGLPGHHSPFISAFLVTLNQGADLKGYLTLNDIEQGLDTVKPEPRWGDIQDDNDPGADFLLLTPSAVAQLTKPN